MPLVQQRIYVVSRVNHAVLVQWHRAPGQAHGGEAVVLRMYLLQNWFNLSDEGLEDAIYDS